MKILKKMKFILGPLLIILLQLVFVPPQVAHAFSNPATVPLGTVSNFAALAKTSITSPTGPTILNNGNLGIDSPGTCTDFTTPCSAPNVNGTINNGFLQFQNAVALTGQTDATAAVTNIGSRAVDQTLSSALGGQTLTQGVFQVPADPTANITGDLTLNGDASSVFIFHLTSTLVTANGSRVVLAGGVQACNVFWKVDSSATFNGTTSMAGTVLASESVTFPGGGATLNGRAIAQTAAITFNNTTVNNSSCAAATAGSSSSSSTSNSNSNGSSSIVCPTLSNQIVTPIIIESRRISPTSILISWGPYSGIDTFNVRYGFENGNWLYNTNVTGFSTTINNLPLNQSIWVQVAARNSCSIGTYGTAVLATRGPSLPNTGIVPYGNNIQLLTIPFHQIQFVSTDNISLLVQNLEEKKQEKQRGFPMRLQIPSINVDAAIKHVDLTPQGAMEVPNNIVDVGWFDLGPRPGEIGSAAIAGHFDGRLGESGVFNNLNKLKQGDKIYILNDIGTTITFVVRESRLYNPGYADYVFLSNDNGAHLNLITCDGAWDTTLKSYSKRLVVFTDITH